MLEGNSRQGTSLLNKSPSTSLKNLWIILTLTLVISGIVLLAFGALPYPSARLIGNRLAPDGELESLTPQLFTCLSVGLQRMGVAVLIAAAGMIFYRRGAIGLLFYLVNLPGCLIKTAKRDLRALLNQLPPSRSLILTLAGLTLFAFFTRLPFIQRPMLHDEAYTFIAFASGPLHYALADYHFPNNHLFHTLLLNLSYHAFGMQPWVIRLPAMIAGTLLAPVAYMLGRAWYGKNTALLAAASLAAAPVLIDYATNARGYSLISLFTLLIFWIGAQLKKKSNLILWLCLSLFIALGFYTIPIMLYPTGILFTWLIFSKLADDIGKDYNRARFARYMVACALLSGALIFLLYLPAFLQSGLRSVVANPYVSPLPWSEFPETLQSRFQDTWREWNTGVPIYVTALFAAGLVLSLVFHRRISGYKVPPQLASVVFLTVIFLIQRPNAWSKIWQFLFPLVLFWSSGGIVASIEKIRQPRFPAQKLAKAFSLAAVGLLLVSSAWRNPLLAAQPHPVGDVESVILFLKPQLEDGDLVVVAPPDDAPAWYYFRLHNIPPERHDRTLPFKRAFVMVNLEDNQTLGAVVAERGPNRSFLKMEQGKRLQTFGVIEVHEVPANCRLVMNTFELDTFAGCENN